MQVAEADTILPLSPDQFDESKKDEAREKSSFFNFFYFMINM